MAVTAGGSYNLAQVCFRGTLRAKALEGRSPMPLGVNLPGTFSNIMGTAPSKVDPRINYSSRRLFPDRQALKSS